jgi:hypothetical protein
LCAHTSIRDQQFYFPHIAFEAIDRGEFTWIVMHRYAKINLLILGFEMDHGAEISNKGSSRKVLISSEDMDLNQPNTNKIYHYSH